MIASLALALVATATDPSSLIATASSTCAAFPLRSTGTIHYFCDCQAGAQPGCVPGNDDVNDGLSMARPKRTWGAATAAFNAMKAGDTIALCRGGLWNVPAGADAAGTGCGYPPAATPLRNAACAAGSSLTDPANASTCDLRDYAAPWGGTSKPVLYAFESGPTHILTRDGGGTVPTTNGVRILNLEFRGGNAGPNGGVYRDHVGIGISTCNYDTDDAWLVCNDTFTRLRLGIYVDGKNTGSHYVFWGNRFTMNDLDAFLGSPGSHSRIDANSFDDNGGFSHPISGNQAHTVYLSGGPVPNETTDVQIVNNEFRRSRSTATVGPAATPALVGHEYYDGLLVENNVIDMGAGATAGAWNIGFNNAVVAPYATRYRHTVIRRNLLLGAGAGINVGSNAGGVIEDNVIALVSDTSDWMVGIQSPIQTANEYSGSGDDVANDVTIRNNTIYISGPGGAYSGIVTGSEGTGHVVANNAVTIVGPSTGSCFDTKLGAGAYAFVGNNACHGSARWGTTLDATTHLTADPLFVNPPGDLSLQPTSPLLAAGDPAHASANDFLGRPRPGRPAIGAYDAGGTSSGGTSGNGTGGGGGGGGGCDTSNALPGSLAALALLALLTPRKGRTTP